MSQAGLTKISSAILPGNVLTKVNVQTGVSPVVPAAQTITFNGAVVAAGTHPVRTDGTGASTMALEVQTSQAIAATDATKIGLSAFNSAQFTVDANGFVSMIGGSPYISLSPYIVGPDAHSGFATIAAAIAQAVADGASASNPKNIYIKPQNGGYTENLTLSDGINLIGFGSSYNFFSCTTAINGKITMTSAGTASITGLILQTNSDYVLEITGANAVIVILNGCKINATNSTAFHCTNASGVGNILNSTILLDGNVATYLLTGGVFEFYYCRLTKNSGAEITSTATNASVNIFYCDFDNSISHSGTGSCGVQYTTMLLQSSTLITTGSGTDDILFNCRLDSGTASAISVSGGAILNMSHSEVKSSNANCITGAGTLKYAFITFTGSSSTVNTAVQTPFSTLI